MMNIRLVGLFFPLLLVGERAAMSALPPTDSVGANVVSVNGKVTVSEKDIAPGDELTVGSVVITKVKSGAKLIMPDNSIVDLGPNTSFKVEEITKDQNGIVVTAKVDLGTVRASIKKKYDKKEKFFIRTKASVLAVRGTEFVLSITQNNTKFNEQVTVGEGEVAMRPLTAAGQPNVEPVLVSAGKQFTREGNFQGDRFVPSANFKMTDLGQGQAKEVLASNTVQDQTFTQVVTVSETNSGPTTPTQGKETLAVVSGNFTPPPPPKEGAPLPGGKLGDFRPPPVKGIDLNYVNELNPAIVQPAFVTVTVNFTP